MWLALLAGKYATDYRAALVQTVRRCLRLLLMASAGLTGTGECHSACGSAQHFVGNLFDLD
jgi:hypothetical protein